MMKTVRFGIIGGGLMGREFASAAARWMHLPRMPVRPELVALCDRNVSHHAWYRNNFPALRQVTTDYRELLANPEVEAVYVAVRHNAHREIYCAAIEVGKHLLGEKPFGMHEPDNAAILAALRRHPHVFARCSSEFPFFPGMQKFCDLLEQNALGQLIEAETGFLHSSDLDPGKPINWKRMVEFNGEYGVMGDLGLHAVHVPFRAGWQPRNVRAILSNLVPSRPDGRGGRAPCDTWDNASLLVETVDPATGGFFPWSLKLQRIAPGEKNTWYAAILGTRASARWSSRDPKTLEVLEYAPGGAQNWQRLQTGHETAFPTITGPIFEFGFSDSILQMWAAFLHEFLQGKPLKQFAGCVTPAETALSHRLFTAALESHRAGTTVTL